MRDVINQLTAASGTATVGGAAFGQLAVAIIGLIFMIIFGAFGAWLAWRNSQNIKNSNEAIQKALEDGDLHEALMIKQKQKAK